MLPLSQLLSQSVQQLLSLSLNFKIREGQIFILSWWCCLTEMSQASSPRLPVHWDSVVSWSLSGQTRGGREWIGLTSCMGSAIWRVTLTQKWWSRLEALSWSLHFFKVLAENRWWAIFIRSAHFHIIALDQPMDSRWLLNLETLSWSRTFSPWRIETGLLIPKVLLEIRLWRGRRSKVFAIH